MNEAKITSFTNDSVCIQCILKPGSLSSACYIIFQHTTSTQPPLYRQISRLSDETTLHHCISDVPDGTYNISVIDSPSYDNKRYNRIVVMLTTSLTIYHFNQQMASSNTLLYSTTTTTAKGI